MSEKQCVISDCQPAAGKGYTDGTWCDNKGPAHMVCSRARGHTGDHVACNTEGQHEIERWAQVDVTDVDGGLDLSATIDALDALQSRVGDAQNYLNDAYNYAENAENEAYSAKNQAEEAESSAMDAKSQVENAKEELECLEQELDTLLDMVRAALSVTTAAGERSLKDDIRRWKPVVYPQLQNGKTHSQIASKFNISEFLVQCIADELVKDQAA